MSSNKSFSTETSDRYARAMLELAQENDELNNVEKSILQLLEIYNSSKEFENFVTSKTTLNHVLGRRRLKARGPHPGPEFLGNFWEINRR